MDGVELELLDFSQKHGRLVNLTVNACAYSCCGRGWQRRDGYEQHYRGIVRELDKRGAGTFTLWSRGIGTVSYVVAVRFDEVEAVA